MTENRFQVAFEGRIAPGAELSEVKSQLARLFKTDPAKVEPLFSGTRVVIRRNLDEATALKYVQAMKLAGALAEVVDPEAGAPAETVQESHQPDDAPPATRPATPDSTPGDLTLAEPGADLSERVETPEPQIDVSGLSLAPVGERLVEAEPDPPPADIDISSLTLE